MSIRNFYFDDTIYEYIINNSLRDLPILKKLRDETGKLPDGRMQISPDQGQFMGLLVKLMNPGKIIPSPESIKEWGLGEDDVRRLTETAK